MACNSYWSAYADSEQNFTNTSWDEKHTLDFTAPAQGDYLIFVSLNGWAGYEYLSGYTLYMRVQLDDTTTIMEANYKSLRYIRTLDYPNFSTVYLAENLASGSHYIDIDCYISSESNNEGYIQYAKIIVLRLDDWLTTSGMYNYENTESEYSPAASSTWYDIETLTFTPDQADDYLILASCEAKSGSTAASVVLRLDYDGGSEYLPVESTEEGPYTYCTKENTNSVDYYSWVWGGIISIPASEKTIKLQFNCTTTNARARKRRIFVVRLAAMDSSPNWDEDPTNTYTTGTTWVDKASKTFTASAVDYLILGGIVLKPDALNEEGKVQINHSAGASPEVIMNGNLVSKDYSEPADACPFFSGKIKELTAASQTFKTQFAGIESDHTEYAKAAWIIIIQIEAGAPPPEAKGVNEKMINRLINAHINDRIN